jgi:hypothetical protein
LVEVRLDVYVNTIFSSKDENRGGGNDDTICCQWPIDVGSSVTHVYRETLLEEQVPALHPYEVLHGLFALGKHNDSLLSEDPVMHE